MHLITILLPILLSVFTSLAQDTATSHTSKKRATYCSSVQIHSMDVAQCDCQPQQSSCSTICPVCTPVLQSKKYTLSCTGGCTDQESSCEGCGIWFHTLCDCLKNQAICTTSGPVTQGGPMIWALLSQGSGDNLVTTTDLLPGILEMAANPTRYDPGWVFAQRQYQPSTQALALNSYRARTQEQLHIHVCTLNQGTYNTLSSEPLISSGHLEQLTGDPSLYCLTVPGGGTVNHFASTIQDFLNHNTVCQELVGAGIMQDKHGNTWACVTTNSAGPIGKFCM